MGQVPVQYEDDLLQVAEQAAQIAREEFDGNLRITGHSLGGGLSSCAAIRLKFWYPDMNISAVTYDSSGLHEATAAFHETDLNMASAANILARSVEDEILTSMQKRTDFLPVGSSLIRYSGPRMPPALGTYDERKGISQGIFGADGGDNPKIYAPKWGQMPNLLDLRSQDLVPDKPDGSPAFEYFENFAGLMASAHDLQGFLENFHQEIDRRVLAKRDERARSEQAEEDAEAAAELAEAEAEAAAEAAEAQAEAAAEAAEAEAEAAAEAAEAESEANEGSGIGDFFYDVFIDEPGDFLSGVGHTATEVLDEAGDLAVDAADEIGDAGSYVWDEGGDLVNSTGDAIGDLGNALYEYAFQYMEEYGRYGLGLFRERSAITALFSAFIDYHSDELAAFTFVFGPRR